MHGTIAVVFFAALLWSAHRFQIATVVFGAIMLAAGVLLLTTFFGVLCFLTGPGFRPVPPTLHELRTLAMLVSIVGFAASVGGLLHDGRSQGGMALAVFAHLGLLYVVYRIAATTAVSEVLFVLALLEATYAVVVGAGASVFLRGLLPSSTGLTARIGLAILVTLAVSASGATFGGTLAEIGRAAACAGTP